MNEIINIGDIPLVGRNVHVKKNGFDFWGVIKRVFPDKSAVEVRLDDNRGYISGNPQYVDEINFIV